MLQSLFTQLVKISVVNVQCEMKIHIKANRNDVAVQTVIKESAVMLIPGKFVPYMSCLVDCRIKEWQTVLRANKAGTMSGGSKRFTVQTSTRDINCYIVAC